MSDLSDLRERAARIAENAFGYPHEFQQAGEEISELIRAISLPLPAEPTGDQRGLIERAEALAAQLHAIVAEYDYARIDALFVDSADTLHKLCAALREAQDGGRVERSEPELFDSGEGTAVLSNPGGRFHGWLFIRHSDGYYISRRQLLTIPKPWGPEGIALSEHGEASK